MRNEESVNHLQRLLVEYEEAKRVFDETKNHSGTSILISPDEICNGIKALYKLKYSGDNIKRLYECQNNSRTKEYKNTEYIHKNISKQYNRNEGKTKKKTKDSDTKKKKDSDNKKSGHSDREGSRNQRRGKVL